MNKSIPQILFLSLGVFLFIHLQNGFSQATPQYANSHYTFDSIYYASDFPNQVSIPLPPAFVIQDYFVKSAMVSVGLRTGPIYTWGSSDNLAFQLSLEMSMTYPDIVESFTYTLHNEAPEALFVKDFTSELERHSNNANGTSILLNLISPVAQISNEIQNTNMSTQQFEQLLEELQIVIHYDIEYGIGNSCNTSINPVENRPEYGRYYTFSWDTNGCEFPDYQFQLLRLYNSNPASTNELETISAVVDWEKAMNYNLGSSANSITIAIAEGMGFYVWRVRPIGSFYPGGIANSQNYGKWNSGAPANNAIVELNRYNLSSPPFFFFEDPDEDKNWIYSRVFTEQGKIHETMTFASDLLHIKQEQSHFPSQEVILGAQFIQDFSGRTALNTLPVPLSNQTGLTYQERFIQPRRDLSTSYTPEHFDTDSTYRNPLAIEDSISAMQYYSSNNPDLSIPDADGFAFQRTLFHSDGTGRVQEQSGVGPTHMLSDDPNRGKTIKTQYAVPSGDELIQLFGAEAPHHESVRKVITIDENGTATIQYISNTGNLIATALSFQDGMEHILPLNSASDTSYWVSDTTTRNTVVGQSLIASRRLALIRPSPLNINYQINCLTLKEGCLEATLDCGYELTITLHNLSDRSSRIFHADNLDSNCADTNQQIEFEWSVDTLLPGEYIIEKRLNPIRPPSTVLRINADSIKNQVSPITDVIISGLEEIEELHEMKGFYSFLREVADYVNNRSAAELINKYQLSADYDSTGQQFMEIYGETPHTAIVGSTCCSIEIPIYFTPLPVCNQLEFDSLGKLIPTSYPEFGAVGGFEQYAIDYLAGSGCISRESAEQLFYDGPGLMDLEIFEPGAGLIEGWQPGEFDEMLFKMLTDEYACHATEEIKIQYNCDELMACWTGVLSLIRDQICQQRKYLDEQPTTTRSGAVDEESGSTGTHDNHINENSDGKISWPMSMLFPGDPADEIRDQQTDLRIFLNEHLVKAFLDCTGYHFAAIFPSDYSGNFPVDGYSPRTNWSPPTRQGGLENPFFGIENPVYAFKYFHYDYTHPEIEIMSCFRNPDTCYIQNPEPGFPNEVPCCEDEQGNPIPCEYCGVGRIECDEYYQDWNCGQRFAFFEKIRNVPSIFQRESLPPNEQPGLNWDVLCQEITKEVPEIDWDLKSCRSPVITLVEDGGYMDTCSFYYSEPYYMSPDDQTLIQTSIAGELILRKETKCKSECEIKRQRIRDSLLLELDRKCYTIGGCATDGNEELIPLTHIDQIVEQLVGECLKQCTIRSCNCRTMVSCRPLSVHREDYGFKYMQRYPVLELGVAGYSEDSLYASMDTRRIKIRDETVMLTAFQELRGDFSFREAIWVDQATNWFMQIELPSKCETPNGSFDCIDPPEPDEYYDKAKARLQSQNNKELDLFETEEEILPTLKSPEKSIQIRVDQDNN